MREANRAGTLTRVIRVIRVIVDRDFSCNPLVRATRVTRISRVIRVSICVYTAH